MSKNYLNRGEQVAVIVLTAGMNTAEAKLENKWFGSPDEQKYLKYIKTYSVKYFEALGARITREEYEKLKKFNNRHQLKILPNDAKEIKTVSLSEPTVMDLLEYAVAGNCDTCQNDIKECRLRRVMIEALIPNVNETNPEKCEYYPG